MKAVEKETIFENQDQDSCFNKNEIIQKTANYIKSRLDGEASGHDWWHVYRVWRLAKYLAKVEQIDTFVVELAALLHDIADWKFHDGDESMGPKMARQWLESLCVEKESIDHVCQIIKDISFKGAQVVTPMKSKEGMVVQDSDRLDAIGAVGIGRCFAYGGYKNNPMYDPDMEPIMHTSAQNYKTNQSTSINHFYEKLLLLKDRMNTDAARVVAQERHAFMEQFLERFLLEWDGSHFGD